MIDEPRLRWSEALHHKVREAGERFDLDHADFEELALEIAAFQMRYVLPVSRLQAAHCRSPTCVEDLAPVPTDVFRVYPPFAFPLSQANSSFRTSGTTMAQTGHHHVRQLETYRQLSVAMGRRALIREPKQRHLVVALMPQPGPEVASSLAFMTAHFMQVFDGCSASGREPAEAVWREPERWLFGSGGVRRQALAAAIESAQGHGEPVLLLATSFALLELVDRFGDQCVPLPPGSVVMSTGGFKGRTREVEPAWLAGRVQELLTPSAQVAEYGMTELSSQLYEPSLPGGGLRGKAGSFVAPPWLRVQALDPASLKPVVPGQPGLACFTDLANVDSALRVLTQDLVCVSSSGVRLMGRLPQSPARGCSLAIEGLVVASGGGA